MVAQRVDPETDPKLLHAAILRRLPRRTTASGQVSWPAIPALADHYGQTLLAMFEGLGFPFGENEKKHLRAALARHMNQGWKRSPFSRIVIDYKTAPPPDAGLSYNVSHDVITLDDEYEHWVADRQPPLFGAHADAKVMALARSLGEPANVRVLDVGAGTGRNTLPLARAGFAVDANELAPALASVLRNDIHGAGVEARVFEGDALDPALEIPEQHYHLIVLAEVVASHFRDPAQLRRLFERAERWLVPGGLLLFSAFIANDKYVPDSVARQASQVFWSCLFTRRELERARRGLAFERVSDESTYEFERTHLPSDAWPPTGWFEEWARGQDVFSLADATAPHELRWLVYRRLPAPLAYDEVADVSVSASIDIDRPSADVFAFALDPGNFARIFRGVPMISDNTRSEFLDPGEPHAGTRRRLTLADGSSVVQELTEHVPGTRQRYRWLDAPKLLGMIIEDAEAVWTFDATASGGTRVSWTYRVDLRGPKGQRLLRLPMRLAAERWMQHSLAQLRGLLTG